MQLKLHELEQEHRDLDHAIATLEERLPYDRLTLQRMKKRKLMLKDKIFQLKDKLEPDIIA
ncbi:YdcH family protein [Aquisalinus flavus]|uniref:YdcH family protein n=1 Tax=Aquisalinus flavus TaxID=1526572 RepID=UPI003570D04B